MVLTNSYVDIQKMSVGDIRQAAIRKYRGNALATLSAPAAGRAGECNKLGSSRVECLYWLETGLFRKDGRLIRFVADDSGLIENVKVTNVRCWIVGEMHEH